MVLLAFVSNAQDYKADFAAIYENYEQLSFYQMDIKTTLYNKKGGKGELQSTAVVAKSGDKYYTASEGYLNIREGAKILSINKNDKWVLYREDLGDYLDVSGEQYKELLNQASTQDITLKQQKGDVKIYEFPSKEPSILAIEIELDTKKKRMNRVTYYYNNIDDKEDGMSLPYKVEMILSIDDEEEPKQSLFDMKEYIIFSEEGVELQSKYSTYQLLKQ
jgi:hypothetical protein